MLTHDGCRSNWAKHATEKTIRAAEAALADHKYVSALDMLVGTGRLAPSHVDAWRKGRVRYLEEVIQGSLSKISFVMKVFRDWARERELKPSETVYLSRTRRPQPLQFSKSGDPAIAKLYRTHYVSPELTEAKRARLEEKLSAAPDLVVYSILRDSECFRCKKQLPHGSFLVMEKGEPLCLDCADLGHLVYLPSGQAALTRRREDAEARARRRPE